MFFFLYNEERTRMTRKQEAIKRLEGVKCKEEKPAYNMLLFFPRNVQLPKLQTNIL